MAAGSSNITYFKSAVCTSARIGAVQIEFTLVKHSSHYNDIGSILMHHAIICSNFLCLLLNPIATVQCVIEKGLNAETQSPWQLGTRRCHRKYLASGRPASCHQSGEELLCLTGEQEW